MKKQRKFKHLDQNDRDRMEILLKQGHKQVDIAAILKVNKGTISREIQKRKRKDGRYESTCAQHKALIKRSNSKYQGMKIEKHSDIQDYIITKLKNKRSPDEIAGYMKRMKIKPRIGTNAIYKWLYSVYGVRYTRYLCTKRHKRKPINKDKPKRVMIPDKVPISQRPLGAANKSRYGHFEGDTIVAPKKVDNTESVAVASELKSKLLLGTKIPSLSPKHMEHAVNDMNTEADIKTMTLDNGIENRSHKSFGMSTYFCDAHSPWQKPLIEQSIGLLRRWFIPKGTDLAKVSEKDLQNYISILNNKYRKSLNYKSAYEVALEHGIIKKNFRLS